MRSIDGHAALLERRVVVEHRAGARSGKRARCPRAGRGAHFAPQRRGPRWPRAGWRGPCRRHVEQDEGADLLRVGRGIGLRAADPALQELHPRRGLLAVEEDEAQLRRARRAAIRCSARAAATTTAPPARHRWPRRSPGCPACRSARRARSRASCPGSVPTTFCMPGGSPGTASRCPDGSSDARRAASRRDASDPAGRGPSATCSRSRPHAQAPSKRAAVERGGATLAARAGGSRRVGVVGTARGAGIPGFPTRPARCRGRPGSPGR